MTANTPLPEVGDLVQLPQLPPGKYATITAVTDTTITADTGKELVEIPIPKRYEDRQVADNAYPRDAS